MFSNDMREVMNINLELLGMGEGKEQSGVAMRQKILQQLLGNDFLFDNLSFAKQKLGRLLVAHVQRVFNTERILRILNNQNLKELAEASVPGVEQAPQPQGGVAIGGQPLNQYMPGEIAAMLDNTDLTNYDVIVSESPNSPSAMTTNFLLLLDIAAKGIPIPPEAIIEFAPIPAKERILSQIRLAAQEQAEQEKMKYDTEIRKAEIASEGGPPTGAVPPTGGM
jgi:hypothetical protein